MITLKLTSPNMIRPEVKFAQKILKDKGYYKGNIDSIYGELSARATRDAKWDLGYAENNIDSNFDKNFMEFLTGQKRQTILMKQRAKSRNQKNLGEKAVDVAMQFRGVSEEPPGSNRVMFSNWYGVTGPWCAMFVTYCFTQAKSKAFVKGKNYAYCPYILNDAKYNRNNLRIVDAKDVRVGDLVLYDWKGDGVADHVGIVTKPPIKAKSGTFTAIEGNTSGTNASDGGMVALMQRNINSVIAFIRVLN